MPHLSQSDEKLRILVADDIESSRKELLELVRQLGHETIEAASGEEALRLIDIQLPDVILLDLLMPHMDGFEVVQKVRQRVTGKWLPVIVLSSLEGEDHFVQALQLGAADYLVKPVKPVILKAKFKLYQRILSMQSKIGLLAQRQHAIHEHVADAIITIDEHGLVSELNRAARRIFQVSDAQIASGFSIAEMTGLTLDALLTRTEVKIHLHPGQDVWFRVAHNSWSIGSLVYVTISLHDLSEAKRIERMKDEFLATVSHELRTPLTSILGALSLLAAGAGGTLPSGAAELAEVAKRNGERLSRLIDDVLDLTKLEGNRMPFHLRTVLLPPLIEEAIHANTSYAQRAGVRIALEHAAHTHPVQVDPDRFLQVMANLLSNAIKHSPKDSVVRIVLQTSGNAMLIQVIDKGPGIDKNFKDKLFEKFSQADSSDRRALGGTGLGLFITRMLVEKMGGAIFAESGAQEGTVFTVRLPCAAPPKRPSWVLCIVQDRQLQERLQEWLHGISPVELTNNLDGAAECIARFGLPTLVLADPQAQGLADQFCTRLLQMVGAERILLTGASLDSDFVAKLGVPWCPLPPTPRLEFGHRVRTQLANAPKE